MIFPHFNLDPAKENPIVKYAVSTWSSFSLFYKKSMLFLFKDINLTIDEGFLLEDLKET